VKKAGADTLPPASRFKGGSKLNTINKNPPVTSQSYIRAAFLYVEFVNVAKQRANLPLTDG
jgi:hypothetical protein